MRVMGRRGRSREPSVRETISTAVGVSRDAAERGLGPPQEGTTPLFVAEVPLCGTCPTRVGAQRGLPPVVGPLPPLQRRQVPVPTRTVLQVEGVPMLESLKLKNVGPAPEMSLEFSERLNLLTGDNGLGKSFLLDVAWWALTRRWPRDLNPRLTSGYPAKPTDPKKAAEIEFAVTGKAKSIAYTSNYSPRDESWVGRAGRPWNPGLVLYAHADGGFAVWDPARNYWKKKGNVDVQERLPGFVFSPQDVWNGLVVEADNKQTTVCNGLLADWASWIRERGDTADRMKRVLDRLSPDGEHIEVGPLLRLSVSDVRDIPSIRTPYVESVPILHASSGIRRIVGLAYMLLWSWNEHIIASELLGEKPTRRVVILFDELESHLHPRWQRTILSSLLHVAESLHEDAEVQLIAATHSPLVLASAEPLFDAERDSWFDLDLEWKNVVLRKRPFVRLGDVSNWLTSEAFDLKSPRSLPAEKAIETALAVLREAAPSRRAITEADRQLREARLPDIDPFWVRWGSFVESHHSNSNRPPTDETPGKQKSKKKVRGRTAKNAKKVQGR